jgi:8-oxo-dGTP pyrophosphatase MutT (NUDIX family)
MSKYKREISSGGVIFKKTRGIFEIALTSRENGRVWCLPKGLIDEGESPEQAAIREVREETGLDGKLILKIGDVEYWYYSKWEKVRVFKTVHFYLFECTGGNIKDHDFEVDEVKWYSLEDGKKILSYKDEIGTVEKAELLLNELPLI